MTSIFKNTRSTSKSLGSWRKGFAALVFAGALVGSLPVHAGDPIPPSSISVERGAVKSLQLGVGRSMIVDLPEDAQEIFVGDPKIANAIVRSARRLYISTLEAGQTTIFALAGDGRKIAFSKSPSGATSASYRDLLEAAIPDNDIHVRTVGGSIILTGSVASAGDAQKALDIADGFLSARRPAAAGPSAGGAAAPPSEGQSRQFADDPRPRSGQPAGHDLGNPPRDPQAARRQLCRRWLQRDRRLRQRRTLAQHHQSARVNGALGNAASSVGHWRARSSDGDAQAFEQAGRRAHARRTDRDRRLRRTREVSGRRHDPDPRRRNLLRRRLHAQHHSAALRRDAELHAGRAVAGPHPAARRDRSDRHRLLEGRSSSSRPRFPASARARTKRQSSCRRAVRSSRLA